MRLLPLVRLAACLIFLIPFAGPLPAQQRAYLVELSGAAALRSFGEATDLGSTIGGTFRGGVWLPRKWNKWSVELEGAVASPSSSGGNGVGVTTTSLSVLYNMRTGDATFAYAKLGLGSVSFGACDTFSVPGSGPCGSTGVTTFGGGFRTGIAPTMLLRGELLLNRGKAPDVSVSFGVSMMVGSKPLTDIDHDGVYDRYDKCPETPVGAIVDSQGCPNDTDGDGVLDGLDRCPSTPAGATVNAVGCPRDGDEDGVLDGIDECPETPKGTAVSPKGCPLDSDEDGVPDGLDRCPDTPRGATVDYLGCPGDEDNDRVLDGLDRCPGTAPGVVVNAFGCPPDLDSDRDGVTDSLDRCPDTPFGARVDINGCPIVVMPDQPAPDTARAPADTARPAARDTAAAPARDTTPAQRPDTARGRRPAAAVAAPPAARPVPGPWRVVGEALDPATGALRPPARAVLDSVAARVARDSTLTLRLVGHTIDKPDPDGNLRLSAQFAEAVRTYLQVKGVALDRMVMEGAGDAQPVPAGSVAEAILQSRRVEIQAVRRSP